MLISLAAGIGIVATFHRKTTTQIVAVGPTASSRGSTPTGGAGTGTGSHPPGGSTKATGSNGGTTQAVPASTSAGPPSGSVAFDATGCTDCGQTTSPGRCSGWTEAFVNHSTNDVTGITFDPPSGKYQVGKPGAPGSRAWPTPDPASVTLNLDIKPSQTQKVRFLTCASAVPPAPNAIFVAAAPKTFTWQWITGQRGSGCFAAACG